jgi:hypothetical protein
MADSDNSDSFLPDSDKPSAESVNPTMSDSDSAEFLSVVDAAALLRLPERTIRRYGQRLTEGNVRHERAPTGQVRKLFRLEALRDAAKGSADSDKVAVSESVKPVKPSAESVKVTLSELSDSDRGSAESQALRDRLAEAEKQAAVAQARAELLEKTITDTQADRDAWKEQAARDSERLGEALRALAQAQDETRAVRALSARANVGLIEPQGAQNGPQGAESVPEAPMEPPTADTAQNGQRRGFWRRLVDSFSGGG